MSRTNVFFCNCGRQIGRIKNEAPAEDAPPIYNVAPWFARPCDGKFHGIKCGTCRQNWLFKPPADDEPFVDVLTCCRNDKCVCWA